MSVDFMSFEWWLDDGEPWVRHKCMSDGRVDEWRLPPPWRVNEKNTIEPSFDCKRCGAHTFLHEGDRIKHPHGHRLPAPGMRAVQVNNATVTP